MLYASQAFLQRIELDEGSIVFLGGVHDQAHFLPDFAFGLVVQGLDLVDEVVEVDSFLGVLFVVFQRPQVSPFK